jgi:hypothetical protein
MIMTKEKEGKDNNAICLCTYFRWGAIVAVHRNERTKYFCRFEAIFRFQKNNSAKEV